MISDAVGSEVISKVTGYKMTQGDFSNTTPNLPQRVAILGEANQANQAGLTTGPYEITSAQQAGELFGYGSPIHMVMRILRPQSGTGIGGIPTLVYPQASSGANELEREIAVTAPLLGAEGNAIHTVLVNGRRILDGQSYNFQVEEGDDADTIATKIEDAMNSVLGCPFLSSSNNNLVQANAKWAGETSNGLTLTVDTNGNDVGVTYAYAITQPGSGTPSVQSALDAFGNEWNTIVVNTYGTNSAVMTTLETFNGIPDPENPTGRYTGTIMKPFIALTGSVLDEETTVTDARPDDVTIAICPAPRSAAHPMEAAANMAILFARKSQDSPHLDVAGQSYPDMPIPANSVIGPMDDFINRDVYVKKGCSTVLLNSGKYEVVDFVTTFHPTGVLIPQYRYCRNLMLDFNVRYGYYLLELINVIDHAISTDNQIVDVDKVVKPKKWKAILNQYADDLATRALIVEPEFMKESLQVGIGGTNPDRFETFFRYKRSGFARVTPTTAEAGFNFGN